MPILENTTDYSEDDQLTAANLNALTETAKFVKNGAGVASTGNTTDEATLDINANGELIVATADGSKGINAAQINDDAITTAKIINSAVTTAKINADAVTNAKIADNAIDSEHYTDGSIDAEHLAAAIISGQTETTAEPADDDELLFSDGGLLRKIDVSDFAKCRFFPQAYGTVTYDTSAPTLAGGYNVDSVAEPSAGVRRITFTAAMADANYNVFATHEGTSPVGDSPCIVDKQTTYFDLDSDTSEATGKKFNFVVFGNRA